MVGIAWIGWMRGRGSGRGGCGRAFSFLSEGSGCGGWGWKLCCAVLEGMEIEMGRGGEGRLLYFVNKEIEVLCRDCSSSVL